MNEKRFRFGIWASIAWVGFAAVLLILRRGDVLAMKPNEWGDFFSGLFAPLAFLWLVLGYLQQGEELKLSTQALRLQAEELKNSVEQQRELVEVSRLQVESEREALAYERALRDEDAKPRLLIAPAGGMFRGDGVSNYNLVLTNTGAAATALLVTLVVEGGRWLRLADVPFFDRGAQHRAGFESPTPLNGTESRLTLSYKDALGRAFEEVYSVGRLSEDPHSDLSFIKIKV